MTFILTVAIIVVVIVLVNQKKKIDDLQQIIRTLEDKAFYNYKQIEALKNSRNRESNSAVRSDHSTTLSNAESQNIGSRNTKGQNVEGLASANNAVSTKAEKSHGSVAYGADAGRQLPTMVMPVQQQKEPETAHSTATASRISTSGRVTASTPVQPYASVQSAKGAESARSEVTAPKAVSGNRVPTSVPVQPYGSTQAKRETAAAHSAVTTARAVPRNKVPTSASVQPYGSTQAKRETAAAHSAVTAPRTESGNRVPTSAPVQPYASTQSAKEAVTARLTDVPNAQQPKKAKFSLEDLLGARIFSIFAAALIYIGLIFLATLNIPSGVRIAIMYFVCGSATALGAWLTKKHRTYFSLGLTGCGLGALFISVLLTHIYFHAINDVTAFALLIVWTAGTLAVSKKLNSLMLSVTAHAGMMISVGFVFALGFSEDRILLPVIYQFISIAVIIVGNIFCCKKTYRFGLLTSMAMMIYSSIAMVRGLHLLGAGCELSVNMLIGLFVFQFIGISFLSYLLAVSATKLKSGNTDNTANSTIKRDLSNAVHIINKSLWTVGAVYDIYFVFAVCLVKMAGFSYMKASCIAFASFTAVMIAHTVLTMIMGIKLNFNSTLETISMNFLAYTQALAMIVFVISTFKVELTFVVAVAAAVVLVWRLTRNKYMEKTALILLCIDAVFAIPVGYSSVLWIGRHKWLGDTVLAGMIPVCILHALFVAVLLFIMYRMNDEESRRKSLPAYKLYGYVWSVLSISSIILSAGSSSIKNFVFLMLALSALHMVLQVISYGKSAGKFLNTVINVVSLSLMGIMVFFGFHSIKVVFKSTTVLLLVSAVYILFVCGTIFCLWLRMLLKDKNSDPWKYKTILYLWILSSIISLMCTIGFTFIAAVFTAMAIQVIMYLIHYGKGKNRTPQTIVNCVSVLMMLIMVFGGFNAFIHSGFSVNGFGFISKQYEELFNTCCVVLLIIVGTVTMIVQSVRCSKAGSAEDGLMSYKFAGYVWLMLTPASVILALQYSYAMVLLLHTLIHTFIYLSSFLKKSNKDVDVIIKTVSLAIMSGMILFGFSGMKSTFGKTSIFLLLSVIYTVLVGCMILLVWKKLSEEEREDKFLTYKTILYFWTVLATASLMMVTGFSFTATVFVIMLIHIVMYMIRYERGKYNYLQIIMNCASVLMMLIMIFGGFNGFIHSGFSINGKYALMTEDAAVMFNTCCAVILTAAVTASMGMLTTASRKEDNLGQVELYKLIIFFWINFSVISIGNASELDSVIVAVVLTIIHLVYAVIIKKDSKEELLSIVTTVGAVILILASCMYISTAKEHSGEMIRYFLLIITTAGLFSAKAYRAIISKNTVMEVSAGLIFTIFTSSVASGLSDTMSVTYIMSVVGMIAALICIITGFAVQAKGLRVYGLVVVILFVIKLITIDMTSANSVERVVAFIIGGIVCFIISGIYTRFEKKYKVKVSEKVSSDNTVQEVTESGEK